jgi:hypothetical protein
MPNPWSVVWYNKTVILIVNIRIVNPQGVVSLGKTTPIRLTILDELKAIIV